MSPATATRRAKQTGIANRRLASGLLLSLIVHGLLLSLQFGVPGLGLPSPSTPQPINITLAPVEPALPAVAAPSLEQLPPLPLAPLPAPSTGMRVIAPAMPKAPVPKAIKPKQGKPRRISRPLPPRDLVDTPARVIAQDNKLSDFAVPMPQPEEAPQKTIDPKEAQDGTDDGVDKPAAALAETMRKDEEDRTAALAAETRAEQERLVARQAAELQLQEQRRAEEQARRQAALQQQQGEERAAQEQQRRQQADLLAARQKADEAARRQKAEDAALRQRAEEMASKQKADEAAARQRAEELARQTAALQQAEQVAREQAEQAARKQAEQVARQLADEATRRQTEQAARQQAEQAAAAGERERTAAAPPLPAGAVNNSAGSGGTGASAPKNLLGSDIGNRVRELTRGIDLLKGAPPQRIRDDDARGGRRVVAFGAEQDVPLRMYVDSFRQKVERNGGLAFVPRGADPARIEPLVSVAIRSDGSVEEVTIVRSSGHAETDNAVRRIVRLNARYSAFPPNIASRFDVIEIRRIWSFAESLRLLEELR